jgi:flagellum-specific peptidoglycan hydrolase FlgJ
MSGAAFGQSAASKYIEKYKEEAIKKMNEYGVPASVILGVAIHESGSGTSKIAKYLNNHFGKKGKNDSKEIKSAYKGYDSVEESYDDFITTLKSHAQFNKLFDKYAVYDYKNWALGIQRGGYAASKTWASQVLAIINYYHLYQYDKPKPVDKLAYIKPVGSQTDGEENVVYKVKKGDTLNAIAKKFNTTVNSIRDKNEITGSNLSIGQQLKL